MVSNVIWDKTTRVISVHPEPPPQFQGGIGKLLFQAMKNNKDHIAQYLADTNETDTFSSLLHRTVLTAIHLKSRNLGKDDIVCINSYNHKNIYLPLLASLFLGIKVSSLDPTMTVKEAAHLLNIIKPKILFVVPECIPTMVKALNQSNLTPEIVVFGSTSQYTPIDDFLKQSEEDEATFQPVHINSLDRTAVINFSSGTTGFPHGIRVSHKMLLRDAELVDHSNNYVILSFATCFWISAMAQLVNSIVWNVPRVVVKKFDPHQTWHLIERYKVTHTVWLPFHMYDILAAGKPKGVDTSSVLLIISVGYDLAVAKIYEVRANFPNALVSQAYGLTEFGGEVTKYHVVNPQDRLWQYNKPQTCGRPIPGFEYKVVNTDGSPCGPNEPGELLIRSKYITAGYYNDTASILDEDGWFHTADMVEFDDDACMTFKERIKNLIKYRGYQVFPNMLEDLLLTHPAVKQCAVFAIPESEAGDIPTAAVQLNYQITAEEILDFVANKVSDPQRLRGGVVFVEALPMTPSGKIRRSDLKELLVNL